MPGRGRAGRGGGKAKGRGGTTKKSLAADRVWHNGAWVDPVVAEYGKSHAGIRDYGDHEVPAYCERVEWPKRPSGVNNYAGPQRLPDHCRQKVLNAEDERQTGPNGSPTGECFQLDRRAPNETQPVLPTLFMPGFPKSASTWLFECMHKAFVPDTVCEDPAPQGLAAWARPARAGRYKPFNREMWSKRGCRGRRYMLPGIACTVTGGCGHRKELFFYGAGYGDYFKVGLAALHGPELPLEMFARDERRPPSLRPKDWEHYRLRRFEEFCTNPKYTHLPAGRMHPSCCTSTATWPKRWGCRWHEHLRVRFGRSQSTWMQTAMPWVRPDAYEFASVDFTPNYLCHAGALRNIYATARDPSELRFIVLMRDPIMRAFSEFSMFTAWGWDKSKSFVESTAAQVKKFRTCNATLFARPDLLHSLPDKELFAYMSKCFKGMAMEYVTNSLYPVCIAGALRIFKREQFLFLRFEDLMRMKAPAVLNLLSNFTGLYTDPDIIKRVRKGNDCEAGRARKVPLSFTKKGNNTAGRAAKASLIAAIPTLEKFYAPYDEMLQRLVHPAFQWGPATHKV